jgi:preprotein translocase subunit YajC
MNWLLMAQAAAPQRGGGSIWEMLAPILPWLIFLFLFYYMFVAAPMKKKQKQFQTLLSNLKNGDRVITNSGMYGTVTGITDKIIKLRIANNVVVDMDKSAIAGTASEDIKEEKK